MRVWQKALRLHSGINSARELPSARGRSGAKEQNCPPAECQRQGRRVFRLSRSRVWGLCNRISRLGLRP